MTAISQPNTRNYDIFKGAIVLTLLIIIAILFIQTRNESDTAPAPIGDVAAPTVNTPQLDADDGTFTLSGTGEPGATIVVLASGVELGTVTVGDDGTWSFSGELDPGEHEIVASTVDAEGAVVNASEAVAVTVEEAEVVVAVPETEAPELNDDGTFTLSGTGEPGATIVVSASGVELGTVTVGDDGTWSFSGELDPGGYDIVASTVDAEGAVVNASEAVAVTVEEAEVVVAVPETEAPELNDDGTFTLSGTGEPGATIVVSASGVELGTVTVADDGTWVFSGELDPGEHEIVASTVDADGTVVNASEAVAITVPEAAVVVALPETEAPELNDDGTFTLSGTGEPGATIVVSASGAELGSVTVADDGTWSFSGELDPGEYDIVASTVDAEGAVVNASEAVAVTVTEAITVRAPTLNEPDALHPGTVTLEGTGEPGATVEILEDGVVVGTATVDEDGTWTFSYSAAAGEHEVTVQNEAQPDSRSASAQISVLASLPVTGTETCLVYVVKSDDWLANLARQLWGEATRYPSIIEATNAMAAADPSFEAIVFPDIIRPGQKLCIPSQ